MLSPDHRRHVAFHEAGHAVAHQRLIGAVVSATIEADGIKAGTVVFADQPDRLSNAEWFERKAIATLAGPAAQRRLCRYSWRREHGCIDDAFVEELALTLCGTSHAATAALARYWALRARNFVRSEWFVISAVAEALLQRKTLDGSEVTATIVEADARCTALTKEFRKRLLADPDWDLIHRQRKPWRYKGPSNRPSRRDIASAVLDACVSRGISEALNDEVVGRLAQRGFDSRAAQYALDRLTFRPAT